MEGHERAMKELPTQKRALLKRLALIEAAVDEFSAVGFEAATAKSIAAKANVATGTFYQYFENKSDILCVIAKMRHDELRERLDWSPIQSVDDVVNKISSQDGANSHIDTQQIVEMLFKQNLSFIYEFHKSNTQIHQVLERRRDLDEQLKVIMDKGDEVLYERTLHLVKSFNIENPDVITQNLFAMSEGIIHRHIFHNSKLDTDLVISVGAKMLAKFFVKQF